MEDRAPDAAPLVSVIITSYNYAHFLPCSIESVLGQDFPSFELLVVDNASTDDTVAVVERYRHDPRLRFLQNPVNIGLTPNHNRGLRAARGRYVLFVSADDMLLPGHLRRSYDYLRAHPTIDVLYTGALLMNESGAPTMVRAVLGQIDADYADGRNEFAANLAEGCYIPLPSMLVPKALYDELGPLDESTIAADYEIVVRWAAAGKRFAYLRTPSVAIRVHGPQASGKSYTASGKDLHDYLAIFETYVVPEHYHLLRGRECAIAGHVAWRRQYTLQMRDGAPLDDATNARVEAAIQRIATLPSEVPRRDTVRGPLISVVVRFETIPQLLAGVDSLLAQADAPPWEAVVVGESGPPLEPMLRSLGFDDRIRFVRAPARDPAAARNLGLRLTSAPIVCYMEPGSIFAPHKFAELETVFAAGPMLVRTDARLVVCESHDGTPNQVHHETFVDGIYRGPEDDRDLVAPAVAIDAVAHLRAAVDRVGPFRVEWVPFDTWEFVLRMRQFGGAYVNRSSVDVRVLRQRAHPGAAATRAALRAVYERYPATPGSPLAARRAAYVERITPLLEAGPGAITGDREAVRFLALLAGIERAELAGV